MITNPLHRPIVYVAHPVGGDVSGNVRRALDWLRWLMQSEPDVAFTAPWIACVAAGADDSDPKARERGLLDCEATVRVCDGIVLCGGRISTGMQRELDAAYACGLYIVDMTSLGARAPTEVWPAVLEHHRRPE